MAPTQVFARNLDAAALQRFGRNGAGGNTHFRRLTFGAPHVTQKIAVPTAALPTRSPSGTWDHVSERFFGNAQELIGDEVAEGFQFNVGQVDIVSDGAWFRRGALGHGGLVIPTYPNPFRFGTRLHWEEGLFRLREPFVSGMAFGYHKDSLPRGQLLLVESGSDVIFRYSQANAAGTAIESFDFTTLKVAQGGSGPNDLVTYNYYRFLKQWDTVSGTGTIRVYLKNSLGSGEQIITLTHDPADGADDDTASIAECHLGNPNAPPVGEDRNLVILWWRAAAHDTSTGISGGASWTDAVVFAQETFESHGDEASTWLDAGQNDVFWSIPFLLGLVNVQGSKVEGRWRAANTKPSGALSSSYFDPDAWQEIEPAKVTEIGDRQGRYLATQLRITPSPIVFMAGLTSLLTEVGADGLIYGAGFAFTPFGPIEPLRVRLGSERVSEGALPVTPDYAAECAPRINAARMDPEFPPAITFRLSTNTRRTWRVGWRALRRSTFESLVEFFRLRRAGEGSFTAPLPEGGTAVAGLVTEELDGVPLGADIFSLEIEVEEVLLHAG